MRSIHFGPAGAQDIGGTYSGYLQDKGMEVVVVRPDFYVFGAIPPGGDINAVLHDLRAQLHLLH